MFIFLMKSIETPVNWPTPPPSLGPGSGIVGEWTLYWTKLLSKEVGLLTTIEPPPRHVGANVGNFTCNDETGKIAKHGISLRIAELKDS